MGLLSKKKIQDKLSVGGLFPFLKQKAKRTVTLAFGIGEALISTIVSLATFGTTGVTFGGVTGAVISVAGAILESALVMGLSMAVNALTSKSPSGGSISNNGRMFNTRGSSEAIRIIYGEVKTGGNWVFADPSRYQNRNLNVVVTAGEGEIEGLAKDIDEKPEFTGATAGIWNEGLDDMQIRIAGDYLGSVGDYKVQIDGAGNPNTFKWTDARFASPVVWNATGVAITGAWQSLNNNIQVKFKNTTGHDNTSYWRFCVGDGKWLGDKLINFHEHYSVSPLDVGSKCIAWNTFHRGASNQLPDTDLMAEESEWFEAMRYTAYSYFRLKWNDYAWNGIPEFRLTIKGRKLHDPRDAAYPNDTPVYSRNPALVWLDFMTTARFGLGLPYTRIDLDSVKDVANWCEPDSVTGTDAQNYICICDHVAEATISKPITGSNWRKFWKLGGSGGTWTLSATYTSGYQFDGAIIDRMAFQDHVEDILRNFRAFISRTNGVYKLRVFTDDTAVMSLTDDDVDIEKGVQIQVPGIPETPNRCNVNYIRRIGNKPDSAFYPDDNQVIADERLLEIALTGTSTHAQAKKLAKYYYLRARYGKTYSMVCFPRCFNLEPGDMVNITNTYLGWTDRKVRVMSVGLPQEGLVPIVFQEENSAIYDQVVNVEEEEVSMSVPGDLTADKPYGLQVIGTGADESTRNKVDAYEDLGWTNPGDGCNFVLAYRKSGASNWTSVDVTNPGVDVDPVVYRIHALPSNTVYEWKVRQKIGKSLSEWAIPSPTTFTTWAPAGPATVAFDDAKCNFAGPNPVVAWTALATEPHHYELRTEDANWGAKDAKFVAIVSSKATIFDWKEYVAWCDKQSLTEVQRRSLTIYIKAVDKVGAYSAAADSIALSNSAPTMSGYSPTVIPNRAGLHAVIKWADWAGITATDLDEYKIYVSTEATCTINADNLKKTVSKKVHQVEVTDLSRGVTYDFRVVPWDIYGEGVASS